MFYSTKAWHRARLWQLTNYPLCRICHARGKIVPATEVDHIHPISKGGALLDAENFQSLCKSCHTLKTHQDEGHVTNWGCDLNGYPIMPGGGSIARD